MRTIRLSCCALLVLGLLAACSARKKEPGDACRSDANTSVCIDGNHAGSCRLFTWHVDPCRGPGGCSGAGVCDQSIAAVDDACPVDGAHACSATGTELLRCEGGTMVAERACHGERGCFGTANTPPTCDPGQPEVGDACVRGESIGCSADGTTLLECSRATHRVVVARRCLGPKGCFHFNSGGHSFDSCDRTVGNVGESCEGYTGVEICSPDRQELYACKDGFIVPRATCACAVSWSPNNSSFSVACDGPSRPASSAGAQQRKPPAH